MAEDDLREGKITGIEVAGKKLEVGSVQCRWRDTGFRGPLPHLSSRLSEGDLDAYTLTCAAHLREFDALTGRGANPGNSQLNVSETRVADGNIEVLVPDVD
jgi:toluene monooxygenase system ferredoxin subunit